MPMWSWLVTVLALLIGVAITEIIRGEYHAWASALARLLVRIAAVMFPRRGTEWIGDVWYLQSGDDGKPETGLWVAFSHFMAAPWLAVRDLVRPLAGDGQTFPTFARSSLPHERVDFAHNSERQFAKLLDFYQIGWEYEPTSFDIEWDHSGEPSQRFAPDFYLPHFDIYIEITTLNQKLVTKKNRKVQRLMTLYPDVRCKILYQRDYFNLLLKYGLEEREQGPPPGPRGGSRVTPPRRSQLEARLRPGFDP